MFEIENGRILGYLVPGPLDPGLQRHYLLRLHRIYKLKRDHGDGLNADGYWLLDHAAAATYIDCIITGAKQEADEIVRRMSVETEAGES